ncbi:MAG TPA: phage portal protein [Pyrinomonadaceae bacterium]|jgi:HK97 family phage portal protein
MAAISNRFKKAFSVYEKTGRKSASLAAFLFDDYGHSSDRSTTVQKRGFFSRAAVDVSENSAAAACLGWSQRNFRQAPLKLFTVNADREKTEVLKHPALKIFKKPNPFYSAKLLWNGINFDYQTDGNAYLVMAKNAGGRGIPFEIWWIPQVFMRPYWNPANGQNAWIEYYEYTVDGRQYRVAPEDVIHFRNGVDPANPRMGKAPLRAALDEVMTDEEVSQFLASLLRNMAIPGTVLTPEDENLDVSEGVAEDIKEVFDRSFSGDGRGSTIVLRDKWNVETLGFAPKDLELGTVRHVPEQRISACLGIPLEVVGLGAGKETSTYNNLKTALRMAFEQNLIPTWDDFADELTTRFLSEFGADETDLQFAFDYSKIPALQDDTDAKHKRANDALRIGAITLNQYLSETGRPADPAGDYYLRSGAFVPVTPQLAGQMASQLPQPSNRAPGIIAGDDDARSSKKAPLLLKDAQYLPIKKDEIGGEDNGLSDELETYLRSEQQRFALELAEAFRALGADVLNFDFSAFDLTDIKVAENIGVQLFEGRVQLFVDVFEAAHARIEAEILKHVAREIGVDLGAEELAQVASKLDAFNGRRIGAIVEDLKAQAVSAVRSAIVAAGDEVPLEEIVNRIAANVSGRELYPGKYAQAYQAAIDSGLSAPEAEQIAESAARNYRAKVIAETETRWSANYQTVEAIDAAGVETVKIADGVDCGWTFHADSDKANGSIRTIQEARKYLIAHPRCQRRILAIKVSA